MRGKVLVVHDDILSQEEFKAQNKLFVDAAKKMNISLDFVSNVQLYTYIDNSNVKCHETFGTYDYAIFFDKDSMYIGKANHARISKTAIY